MTNSQTTHTQRTLPFLPKNPAVRFLLLFGLGMILFYIFYKSSFFANYLNDPIVSAQAGITSLLVNLFGEQTTVTGTVINDAAGAGTIDIKGGCDGLEATALFLCAVAVFPVSGRLKLPGLLAGLAVLAVLNIIRLTGLFFAKKYGSDQIFNLLHEQGGFVLFTAVSILLWMIWVNWALRKEPLAKTSAG